MSELRQRRPPVKDPGYLAFLRTKPCCVCGAAAPSDAAHIRMGFPAIGKEPTGMGQKPDDKYAVPLCRPIFGSEDPKDIGCHATQHKGNEERFWIDAGKLPFQIAETLYLEYSQTGGTPPVKRWTPGKKSRPRPKKLSQKIPTRPFPKGRGFAKKGDRHRD